MHHLLEQRDSLTHDQIEQLVALYHGEWWALNRTVEDVRQMLENSDVVIAFVHKDSGALMGFARVLSDFVYKALIFDVIVRDDARNTGLGKRLMDAIVNHPRLGRVRHFELYCLDDMIPFYERWGFTTDVGGIILMRRST